MDAPGRVRARTRSGRIGPAPGSVFASAVALLLPACAGFGEGATDAGPADGVVVCEAVWRDGSRARDVPVRIRMPDGSGPVPVVLFSHGLGGSLEAGTRWARHWAAGGIAVLHLQHPGSDARLLRDDPGRGAFDALRAGMSGAQLLARVADVRFVLDELETRSREGACDFSRIDRSRVGMSGHSFGARTTQALAGQGFPARPGSRPLADDRILAAVAFSPSPPPGSVEDARAAFTGVRIPFFSVTGTRDEVPLLTDVSPEERTVPHRVMPPGEKYLLVFEDAEHSDFGGNPTRRRGGPEAHVAEAIEAATLAFWNSTLLGDQGARGWLEAGRVETLLEEGDRFETR